MKLRDLLQRINDAVRPPHVSGEKHDRAVDDLTATHVVYPNAGAPETPGSHLYEKPNNVD